MLFLIPRAGPARLQQACVYSIVMSSDKPLSPLAMAAQEMLEEAEEEEERQRLASSEAQDDKDDDELAAYWERYDDAKREGLDRAALVDLERSGDAATDDEPLPAEKKARTEMLLARYYKKFGIDKAVEDEHRDGIESAMAASKVELEGRHASSALGILRKELPFVQSNSKLGSLFLFQLASAHEHAGEERAAREVYESLVRNHPQKDVRREARDLLSGVRSRTLRLSSSVDSMNLGWFGGLGSTFDAWRRR